MREGKEQGRWAMLLLSIGVVCVSVSALIARRALTEATPLMLAAWRMGLASLFFLGVQAATRLRGVRRADGGTADSSPPSITQTEYIRLAVAGAALAAHFILWFTSLRLTSVSVATLLVCTTPLWTALGQIGLRRGRADARFWGALLVATLGIALVIRPAAGAQPLRGQVAGDLLALAGGAVFGVYLLAVDGLQHLSSPRIVAWTYTVAAVLLWILAVSAGHMTLRYSAAVWEAIVLLTVVPQIIGHTLINDALNSFQAHVVAFSILAEPVIAAALAVWLLRDVITPLMLIGGLLVLLSLGFVLAKNTRRGGAGASEQAESL